LSSKYTAGSAQSDPTSEEAKLKFLTADGSTNVFDNSIDVNMKDKKLVNWICELLQKYIKRIVTTRGMTKSITQSPDLSSVELLISCGTPMNEIVESIAL
jgi:hypothetical protein